MSIYGQIFLKIAFVTLWALTLSPHGLVYRGSKVRVQFLSKIFFLEKMLKKSQKWSKNRFFTVPVFRKNYNKYNNYNKYECPNVL